MIAIWRTLRAGFLGALCLIPATLAPVQGSYITGNINSGADGVVCGAVNEPFLTCPPYNGPLGLNIGSAALQVDFGLNRVLASAGASSSTEWMVRYGLTGAAPNTQIPLTVEIGFDLTAINAAVNAQSEFRMVLNNNSLFPFIIRIATNGLGNRCDDQPVGAPCMSGPHSGIWTQTVMASVDPNNRLYLNVGASNFGGGLVDAFNTVWIHRIIVPDGINWNYQDLAGNPLNFQHASATAVPEPGSLALLSTGLLVVIVRGRRRFRGVI
ncbi:MAG: PEP-CTERM sorting domain-containing protein [Bryobacteraceae bacterium]|nr:PEP-CTERM sorting domain-containing protein [Bryobacteraceae bacterium]